MGEIVFHARGEMLFILESIFKCEMSSSVVFVSLVPSCPSSAPLPDRSDPLFPLLLTNLMMEERAFTIPQIHVTLLPYVPIIFKLVQSCKRKS